MFVSLPPSPLVKPESVGDATLLALDGTLLPLMELELPQMRLLFKDPGACLTSLGCPNDCMDFVQLM